jgi:hypothetical protein
VAAVAELGSFANTLCIMRIVGFALLVAGFLWIAWDCVEGFVGDQHMTWVWHSQHLPPGELIKRGDAVAAMRALSLDLKNRHRELFIPALLMFAGGLVLGLGNAAWRGKPIARGSPVS